MIYVFSGWFDHNLEEVCLSILKSSFFSNDVEYQDPNNETVREFVWRNLSNSTTSNIDNPFELWLASEDACMGMPVIIPKYGKLVHDLVSPCLAAERGTGKLKLYLVTKSRDFNKMKNGKWISGGRGYEYKATGRFVHEYSQKEKLARLVAVAERPLRKLGNYRAESFEHYRDLKRKLSGIGNT